MRQILQNLQNFPICFSRDMASGMPVWSSRLQPVLSGKYRRGFTDHEHPNEQQLIHMNGRVYDYNLGRFLSVDLFIKSPTSTQSINPYSYIMNNPLAGTEPTGYCAVSDTMKDCAGSLEAGKTQAITNEDGQTVGHIGKDADGNVHITSDASSKGASAVSISMANGADKQQTAASKGSDFSEGGSTSNPKTAANEDSSSSQGTAGEDTDQHLAENCRECRYIEGGTGHLGDNLDYGQLHPAIKLVKSIRGLGNLVEESSNLESLLDSASGEELQLIADILGVSIGGVGTPFEDETARYTISVVMRNRRMPEALKLATDAGSSATELIYKSPAIGVIKSRMNYRSQTFLEAYDSFEKLERAVNAIEGR